VSRTSPASVLAEIEARRHPTLRWPFRRSPRIDATERRNPRHENGAGVGHAALLFHGKIFQTSKQGKVLLR